MSKRLSKSSVSKEENVNDVSVTGENSKRIKMKERKGEMKISRDDFKKIKRRKAPRKEEVYIGKM